MTRSDTDQQEVPGAIDAICSFGEACAWQIREIRGCLVLPSTETGERAWVLDAISVETTLNKRYIKDLVTPAVAADQHDALMRCGRVLVRAWAAQLTTRFPAATILFFLGGSEDVIVRFHVERPPSPNWADLSDTSFLHAARLEVYRLNDGVLTRVG
jgi:hypothetical protein